MEIEEIDASLYRKKRYKTPDQSIVDLLEKRKILKLLSQFAPYGSVLDVPCGYGRNGKRIKKFCKHLIGCDISKNMINEARSEPYDALVIGDIRRLPFEDNSFDLVVCIRLFHHFELEEIKISIDELLRVSSNFVLFSFYRPVKTHQLFRKIRRLPPRIRMIDEILLLSHIHKKASVLYSKTLIPLIHSQQFVFVKKYPGRGLS